MKSDLEVEGLKDFWKLWIDTGGTFTDCVGIDPQGREHRVKILSTSAIRGRVEGLEGNGTLRIRLPFTPPEGFFIGSSISPLGAVSGARVVSSHHDASKSVTILHLSESSPLAVDEPCEIRVAEEAPVLAAHVITGTPIGARLPPVSMRLATTRATNALLERTGAPTALFITRGLGDLLVIGTQQRSDLFALEVRKPEPLYQSVVEVDGRLDAAGRQLSAIDAEAIESAGRKLLDGGIRSAAVALLHSYRNPEHERRVGEILEHCGFEHVSCSADLAALVRLLPRAETTVVDAYLAPVISTYLDGVSGALEGGRLSVMSSAGGLLPVTSYRPKESLLSGPAGGVVGAARAAIAAGETRIISFDMGGTSTDVARYDGDYDYQFETRVGDARILAPALAIETVAAGGGSVCRFDGRQLKVGPDSAGALPGPACYGAGGPLTLTDVNLLLGRLAPDRFEIPLSPEAAEEAADAVRLELEREGSALTREEMLRGFLSIANERMAEVIRRISVRKGYDPAEYVLVAFGGAGAQHALAVASRLGIKRVVMPPDASLLSAHGLGHALLERFVERQILEPLVAFELRASALFEELESEARAQVMDQMSGAATVDIRRRIVAARLVGQESTLELSIDAGAQFRPGLLEDRFDSAYRDRFGYPPPDRTVEIESVRVIASTRAPEFPRTPDPDPAVTVETGRRRVFLDRGWADVPSFERGDLLAGARFQGPALVVERFSALVVEEGWGISTTASGALVARKGNR